MYWRMCGYAITRTICMCSRPPVCMFHRRVWMHKLMSWARKKHVCSHPRVIHIPLTRKLLRRLSRWCIVMQHDPQYTQRKTMCMCIFASEDVQQVAEEFGGLDTGACIALREPCNNNSTSYINTHIHAQHPSHMHPLTLVPTPYSLPSVASYHA